MALFIINDLLLGYDRFLLIFFTDYSHFLDRIILPSTDTAKGKGKWKIIAAQCLI
ncbi:TonB-dependent receptor [Escherichia fergusonii]|nr:TonB-dependent receptor [Escherichia fergusonii]